jgi:beta-lactamase class A
MHRRVARLAGVGLMLATAAIGGLRGQEADDEVKLREAGEALLPFFAEMPGEKLRDRFAPNFLQQVPIKTLEIPLKDLFKNYGKGAQCRVVYMIGPYEGGVDFVFEKGARMPAIMKLESKPPHRIAALQFLGAQPENDTRDGIIDELKKLPGTAAMTFMRLAPQQQIVWEHNGSQAMAVGSCFKLVLFATLVDQIEQDKRSWSDTVVMQKELLCLPSGILQDWPVGSPVTLHTLATLMISRSDNTAAQHLFHLLGRETVEEMQAKIGIKAPDKNKPFLAPGEFFRIKNVLGSEQQKLYVEADAAGKRKLLDTLVKETPLSRPRTLSGPELIDSVEWFFSTGDLCRVMDWLRTRKAPQVKAILAVGRNLPVDSKYWTYSAYKAGQEPGVVSCTLLLQNQHGSWFALAVAWNNPKEDVDHTRVIVFTQRLLRLAQRQQLR